jgi:hypothetical protein
MAKIISSEVESQTISVSYPFIRIAAIGVFSGLIFWLLTIVINKYFVEPLFCKNSLEALSCMNSVEISGNVASVFVAIAGMIAMVKFRMGQPLIVAVTAAAILWGLATWTSGLSIVEAIVWSASTYLLAFLLFSWIVRYRRIGIVLVVILIIIFAARVALGL